MRFDGGQREAAQCQRPEGLGRCVEAAVLVSIAITAVGNQLDTPSLSSLISRAASGDHQGGVLGVSQSMGALARIVGPLVGTSLLQFGIVTPYLAGGAIMLIACVFAAAAVRQPSTG